MYAQHKKEHLPKLKLTYFNLKGRAETARLALAYGQVPFEDERIPMASESEDWSKLKPSQPWKTLPVLEVNGTKVGQSMAIARYVARLTGTSGKTTWESALVDSVVDTINDLNELSVKLIFAAKEEEKKNELIKELEEHQALPNLENFLVSSSDGGDYFVGDGVTWADLHFFQMAERLQGSHATVLQKYPKMSALYERISQVPLIAEYVKNRQPTPF